MHIGIDTERHQENKKRMEVVRGAHAHETEAEPNHAYQIVEATCQIRVKDLPQLVRTNQQLTTRGRVILAAILS
jgi:hypothetical protein